MLKRVAVRKLSFAHDAIKPPPTRIFKFRLIARNKVNIRMVAVINPARQQPSAHACTLQPAREKTVFCEATNNDGLTHR